MAWVRIDDNFAQHPKVVRTGPLGMAMQIAALCYSNRQMTDGFIPKQIASTLLCFDGIAMNCWSGELVGGGEDATWELVVDDLVEAGIWEPVDGGWQVHDYLDYQPSKQEIQQLSDKRKEIGRKGGLASAKQAAEQTTSKLLSNGSSKTKAKAEAKIDPNPNPLPKEEEHTTRVRDEPYTEEFETLWAVYHPIAPKSATKADASRAFERLSVADKAACQKGLPAYVRWLQAERGKRPDAPAKHLATFINRRGWEPFLEVAAPNGNGATKPTVWLTEDDPRFAPARQRWRETRGRDPPVAGSRYEAGIGFSFPVEMVEQA